MHVDVAESDRCAHVHMCFGSGPSNEKICSEFVWEFIGKENIIISVSGRRA